MLSQAKLKLIRSLDHKKSRRESGLFVAEGPKVVGDLLAVMSPRLVVATEAWLSGHDVKGAEAIEVSEAELKKASFLQHPQQVLALFPIPTASTDEGLETEAAKVQNRLCLALDGVQDPGNLGTIIRIADWFGIDTLFCSHETADAYSPKVVQATMGCLARVRPRYVDLKALITRLPENVPVYGTLLDGEDIYAQQLSSNGLIVMGNEGNGISQAIRPLISHRLLIPNYPAGRTTTDSLNVAIATAITCAEFRRRG
jgi:TrmH family RNA methyltransferase